MTAEKVAVKEETAEKIYASMDDILGSGSTDVEYAVIDGFKPGEKIRIGSVTAGEVLEWTEANESAKHTAGLRLICKSLVGPAPANTRYAESDKNIPKFRAMRHKDTERILREIVKLNGMNVKDEEKVKKD